MRRQLKIGPEILAATLLGLGLQGCSTDADVDVVARGPKDLKIVQVSTLNGSVTESGGTLAVACPAEMLIHVGPTDQNPDDDVEEIGEFALAPPGGCGSLTNCGWIQLGIAPNPSPCADDESRDLSECATQVFAIHSPIAYQLPAEGREGGILIRLELLDVWGNQVLTEEGKLLYDEFAVNLEPPTCAVPAAPAPDAATAP